MMTAIDPATSVGAVSLRVNDLEGESGFYEDVIGLEVLERDPGNVVLGVGSVPLVRLIGDPAATPRPNGTTGLFHLAILLPDRVELARALHRVADSGGRFSGASDHLVSEALYLSDPEGNGIEIYRDRPRSEWEDRGGDVKMATLPLDIQNLSGELGSDKSIPARMPSGTRMGHVHLNVADIDQAEAFYSGVLGFEVMVRGYPGALFVAAGGYHHHLGLNTWMGEGAPPPPDGSRGLERFTIQIPSTDEMGRIAADLAAADIGHEATGAGIEVTDPSGNRLALSIA